MQAKKNAHGEALCIKLQFLFQCIKNFGDKEQKLPTHCVQQGTQPDQIAVVPTALKAI